MPAANGCDKLCSTSDVITYDQNWHHLYSSFARGKVVCNDTQITVIGSIESDIRHICTKMLKIWSEENVKRRRTKEKKESRNGDFDFCACPSKNVVKGGASGKEGTSSCCECPF